MPLTNSEIRYGGVTKTFHWLTALLILTAMPLGLYANNIPIQPDTLALKAQIFSIHKTIGVAAFFVALARILWALTQTKPGLLNADKRAESLLAEVVHWLLYASLVIVPLSGWLHHAATTGFAPILWPFGQSLPMVPKSESLAALFSASHYVFTKVLAVSILLHIVGALKHHFIDRDVTLRRMWFGYPVVLPLPAQHSSILPFFAALLIYAGAMWFATTLTHEPSEPQISEAAAEPETEIAAIPSSTPAGENGWVVTDGTLSITVRQFGTPVTGSFAAWNAEIIFDEAAEGPEVGSVFVEIDIESLTLGSATSNALGPEFFDAANFPTAIYEGVIVKEGEAYSVPGTLTLKTLTADVPLAVDLTIDGASADMTGTATIDRRDFQLGAAYGDESTVAYSVAVNITLSAEKAAP